MSKRSTKKDEEKESTPTSAAQRWAKGGMPVRKEGRFTVANVDELRVACTRIPHGSTGLRGHRPSRPNSTFEGIDSGCAKSAKESQYRTQRVVMSAESSYNQVHGR
jgi:hypothetical protein